MRLGLGNSLVRNGGVSSLDALLNGLQAYWKLDEASGTRFDSKNGYDLADTNSVGSGTGILSDCAVFDGSDYLESNSSITYESVTVAFWVYLNSNTGEIGFFGGDNTLSIAIIDQHVYWTPDLNYVSNHSFEGAGFVPANQWVHIVGRWDNNNGRWDVFIDGVNTATHIHSPTPPLSVNRFILGGVLFGGLYPYGLMDGKLDEFGLWSRALSDTEIAQIYNNGNGFVFLP